MLSSQMLHKQPFWNESVIAHEEKPLVCNSLAWHGHPSCMWFSMRCQTKQLRQHAPHCQPVSSKAKPSHSPHNVVRHLVDHMPFLLCNITMPRSPLSDTLLLMLSCFLIR